MRFTTVLILAFASSLLGACGGGSDDVEISLPFVGNIMGKVKSKEQDMATRGTLVLPPAVKGLPAPMAKGQTASADGASWPVDPDQKAKSDAEVAALEEKQYQKDGDWKGKHNTGNGLEDFNKKVDWQRRQTGVLQGSVLKQD